MVKVDITKSVMFIELLDKAKKQIAQEFTELILLAEDDRNKRFGVIVNQVLGSAATAVSPFNDLNTQATILTEAYLQLTMYYDFLVARISAVANDRPDTIEPFPKDVPVKEGYDQKYFMDGNLFKRRPANSVMEAMANDWLGNCVYNSWADYGRPDRQRSQRRQRDSNYDYSAPSATVSGAVDFSGAGCSGGGGCDSSC